MKQGERGTNLEQGELVILAASTARTANGNGEWVAVLGERIQFSWLLNITSSATAASDTLDVYIDVSFDGVNSAGNVAHFTQQAGDGSAADEVAIVGASATSTSTTVVTSDAAAATVRQGFTGPYWRARWVIVDGGGGDTSHTFSVQGYAL